jgi:hypothetical protein
MRRQRSAVRAVLPCGPTGALPGSPEKVAVLMQRARLRQPLWHPQDVTLRAVPSPGEAVFLPARREVG